MLEIQVTLEEGYDEESSKFITSSSFTVCLEHSLSSVSKWESAWEEPFLGKKDKTQKQTVSYIEMMILNEDLPPGVFRKLIENHLEEIMNYVSADMTATKLHVDPNSPQSRETITSELIYYWMISMNIPVQFEHWHLNRLITLIRVINLKNSPKKKMSPTERRNLNRQRLQQRGTSG
jgi:hypothetical protein